MFLVQILHYSTIQNILGGKQCYNYGKPQLTTFINQSSSFAHTLATVKWTFHVINNLTELCQMCEDMDTKDSQD